MGTTGTTWGGDHRDNGDHSHGDHMGTFWGLWEQCGDDGDDTGMMWGQWGQHGDHGDNMGWRPRRQRRPQPWEPHGDLLGAMGTMWGQWERHGDDMGMTWG